MTFLKKILSDRPWLALALLLGACTPYDSTGIYDDLGLVKSEREVAEERRIRYVESHSTTDPEVLSAIRRGAIRTGMFGPEVTAAIGPPAAINKYDAGKRWQWVYGYCHYAFVCLTGDSPGFIPTEFVYFENGRVVSWQSF